jgi:hypothetical protein
MPELRTTIIARCAQALARAERLHDDLSWLNDHAERRIEMYDAIEAMEAITKSLRLELRDQLNARYGDEA